MFSEVRCVAEISVLWFFLIFCLLTAISMELRPKRSMAYTRMMAHGTGFAQSASIC